jgi:hypothetical protein
MRRELTISGIEVRITIDSLSAKLTKLKRKDNCYPGIMYKLEFAISADHELNDYEREVICRIRPLFASTEVV